MKQKLLFFFLTAFLSLIGGGELWADEQVIFILANGSSSDTRVTPVSLSTSGSFQTDNDKPYRNGLRIDAGGYIELTADAGYSISQVQITFTPDDNNDPITYIRSSGLTSITINTDETASWGQTFSNKNYTTYGVLTRTLVEPKSSIRFSFDGSSGSVYVKQLDVTYSVDNRSEIAVFSSTNTWPTVYNYVDNVPSSMIIRDPQNNGSSNFVIKIVATNEEVSSKTYSYRFDTNKLHVSVEDPTVITLGTVHHQNYSGTSGNRQQMYFSEFTILKEGSTRIVVSFDGDENYLPKTVYYDITTKNIRHSSLYSSYPFTWDFANNDWESSKIQMAANSTDWASYSGEGRSKQSSVSATSGIDMIEGLAFGGLTADDGTNQNGTLCLDWTNRQLWMSGTLTIPDLKVGMKVTFTSNADVTGDAKVGSTIGKVFTVTEAGDVTFTVDTYVKAIAVTKTDITFGSLPGSNNTTNVVGASDWNYSFLFYSETSAPLDMTSAEWNDVTFSLPNTSVITFTKDDYNSSLNVGSLTIHPVAVGSVVMNVSFPGSDRYNAKEGTITFTITKQAQTLSFAESTKTVNYGDTPTNTLTQTPETGGGAVTYSSSDTHVAEVNESTGALTIHNAGTCTITATAAENNTYGEATASYTLTVYTTQSTPTITMYRNYGTSQQTEVADGTSLTASFGDNVYVTGICSISGPTVKYSSSNTSVATVDDNGVVTTVSGGTTTITVYTETYQGYPDASVSYTLTVNPTSFTLAFTPTSGKVNVGATITPQMTLPTLMLSDITSITASSDNTSVATVPTNLMVHEGDTYPYLVVSDGKIHRFLPVITGVAPGTTTIKVRFESKNYNSTEATYTVTVTSAGTCNFSWADGENPTYTMYVGDYMKMPAITGNSNGNNNYSKGTKNKYVYHIAGTTVTMNKDDYHLYEGVPDYTIIDNGEPNNNSSHAAIFYAKGQPSNGIPHELLVYARAAGTVTIRAIDPQNESLSCDATLKIVEKTSITNAASAYISSMSFPYTWDFTGNFDMTDIQANSHYWTRYNDDHYAAGDGFFNCDWADSNQNNSYNDRFFKPFVAGAATETTAGNYMPMFYGLEMSLQSGDYAPKINRVRITDYNSSNPDAARLVINGGTTQLRLPKAPNQPSNYRIYMKVKPASGAKIAVGGKKYGVEEYTTGNQLTANTDAIIYFDVTDTSSDDAGSVINLDNVSIYWIATSTEAKNFAKFDNTSYYATTYSYPKDLDMDKSLNDVNTTVQPYYASAFNSADAVTMTAVSKDIHLAANTGVLLKSDDNPGSCYMIAKPQNSTSVPEATSYATNYLKPNAEAGKVYGRDEENNKTRFVLAYRYIWVKADGTTDGTYTPCSDWSFVRAASTGATMSKNTAYLEVPGDIYVMMDVSNAARRAPEVDSENDSADGDENYPATKQLLNIVFEEEQPATPEDPVTEEPEDGDSDKDKDRPRKPGDDGWPKPPFPPFPPIITDIDSVNTETTDNAVWHSMEGVRISQPTKPGLYIRNGKKIVIK